MPSSGWDLGLPRITPQPRTTKFRTLEKRDALKVDSVALYPTEVPVLPPPGGGSLSLYLGWCGCQVGGPPEQPGSPTDIQTAAQRQAKEARARPKRRGTASRSQRQSASWGISKVNLAFGACLTLSGIS